MIFLGILTAAAVLFVFWVRGLADSAVAPAVWKTGAALAIVRVSFVWLGTLGLATAGWMQVAGFALFLFGAWPEGALLGGSLARRPVVYAAVLTPIVAAGSFFWVWVLAVAARGVPLRQGSRHQVP